MAIRKKFDPYGSGYDYRSAQKAGIVPDKTRHWPSRIAKGPEEGLILKGVGHPTFMKTVAAGHKKGYKYVKKKGRYYSIKNKKRLLDH